MSLFSETIFPIDKSHQCATLRAVSTLSLVFSNKEIEMSVKLCSDDGEFVAGVEGDVADNLFDRFCQEKPRGQHLLVSGVAHHTYKVWTDRSGLVRCTIA